jgi:hypothetical protein
MGKLFVLIFILGALPLVASPIKFGPMQSQVFKNKNCQSTKTCNLQEFRLDYRNFEVDLPDTLSPSYGLTSYMSYKTKKNKDYEEFAIVQYIKGCVFSSRREGERIVYMRNYVREFFGELAAFHHPNWVVDSVDSDPMYKNFPQEYINDPAVINKTRHGMYNWSKYLDFSKEKQNAIYKAKPQSNFFFTVDRPATAFLAEYEAKNVSLSFKTCIYKTKDLPRSLENPESFITNAIHCFPYKHQVHYDHEKNQFFRAKKMHSFCK